MFFPLFFFGYMCIMTVHVYLTVLLELFNLYFVQCAGPPHDGLGVANYNKLRHSVEKADEFIATGTQN